MNALNSKYGGVSGDLVILGFPCNNFNKEEPGKNGTEILNGVRWVKPGNNFVPNFQLLQKIEVNGANEHPMYTYLKKHCPPTASEFDTSIRFYNPIKPSDIEWNWETFLIGRDGQVKRRAAPHVEPVDLETDIQAEMLRWTQSIFG